MKIYKEKDYDAVSKRAAALVAAQIKEKNEVVNKLTSIIILK